jgi:hypothetical protein
MTGNIEACVLKLDADDVWKRDYDVVNPVGNLILHLAGNVRQWIGSSIGGEPDVRQRELEFAASSRMETGALFARLNEAVSDALAILEKFPPERLTETVATQDGDRTALEVIYQVVGHFQQHAGQIFYATKLLTGQELNFYVPPKK